MAEVVQAAEQAEKRVTFLCLIAKSKKINDNVKSHSKSDNDRAERNTYNALQREKSVVENLDEYIRLGHIKSANDEWYQNHIESYNSLNAKYKELQKARKKYNK